MQSELQRTLELQAFFQPGVSPEMNERGVLIRDAIPGWLRDHGSPLDLGPDVDDFFAEGRDGTGLKTRVPWARFGSRSRSERATMGFYVVYLFDALGETVYLSLNQGTTDFRGGEFIAKPSEVILERVSWARSALGSWLDNSPVLSGAMDLHDSGLGAGYELGNIACLGYAIGEIPQEATLLDDARTFAEGLGILYREQEEAPIPYEQPELREAEEAAERTNGGKSKRSSAGFRTNATEIRAIETHAVAVARAYYQSRGFKVKELGKPFDLEVRNGDQTLTVEVKGTTSDGSGVHLTAGEVAHHADAFPNNALVIVRNIVLHRDATTPTASGGHLYELQAWDVDPGALRVISYAYDIPTSMYDHAGVPSESLL